MPAKHTRNAVQENCKTQWCNRSAKSTKSDKNFECHSSAVKLTVIIQTQPTQPHILAQVESN